MRSSTLPLVASLLVASVALSTALAASPTATATSSVAASPVVAAPSAVPAPPAVAASPTVATGATILASTTPGTVEPIGPNGSTTSPQFVAAYPNPATDDDAGEFVVLRFPEPTDLGEYELTDGTTTSELPNRTASGRVAFSADPDVAANRTDAAVLPVADGLSLANGGETVRFVAAPNASSVNSANATMSYADAPEGERWHYTETGWTWTPLGASDFAVASVPDATARTFVLPDSPGIPLETLRKADDRILLGGYTFASPRVAEALLAAEARGVDVRLLLEGGPVGGIPRREATLLDRLTRAGIEVRMVGGPLARHDYHHPKYAVADDRALVLTENWKPSGTGGHGSRGWGVVVADERMADRLAAVFEDDAETRNTVPWREFRKGRTFEPATPANETFPRTFEAKSVEVSSADLLVAPDNAESGVIALLDAADSSIRIQQAGIGTTRQPFLRAAVRAARRGVDVKILLSSAWYSEEANRRIVEWVNERAKREGLPLEARLAKPRGRYEKIHAKGVVVDGEAAVVGSLNWNNHSARENREVAVVLRGEEAASFYADSFDADWKASASDGGGGAKRLPVGLLVAVALGAAGALLLARREVVFEKLES